MRAKPRGSPLRRLKTRATQTFLPRLKLARGSSKKKIQPLFQTQPQRVVSIPRLEHPTQLRLSRPSLLLQIAPQKEPKLQPIPGSSAQQTPP
jgi:hypothetical protein